MKLLEIARELRTAWTSRRIDPRHMAVFSKAGGSTTGGFPSIRRVSRREARQSEKQLDTLLIGLNPVDFYKGLFPFDPCRLGQADHLGLAPT